MRIPQLHFRRWTSLVAHRKYPFMVSAVLVLAGVLTMAFSFTSEEPRYTSSDRVKDVAAGRQLKEVKDLAATDALGTQASGPSPEATKNNSLHVASKSKKTTPRYPKDRSLIFSHNSVVLPKTGGGVEVFVSSGDGAPIFQPSFSNVPGLVIAPDYFQPPNDIPPDGMVGTQASWRVVITQRDPHSSGQAILKATTFDGREGSVGISWKPIPWFGMTQGELVRTETETTITYTAYFTLTPNHPYFGNPRFVTTLDNPGKCINTNSLYKTWIYDGQNTHSISCVVQRRQQVSSGALNFFVTIRAFLTDGEPLGIIYLPRYTAPAPYDF